MHVTARVPTFAERAPEAHVPPEVEAIVMRLLKKELTERFEDARELLDTIAARDGAPRRSRAHLARVPRRAARDVDELPELPVDARTDEPRVARERGATRPRAGERALAAQERRAHRLGVGRDAPRQSRVARREVRGDHASILAGMSVLAVVAIVVAGKGKKNGSITGDAGAAAVASGATEPPSEDEDDDARIAAALASIDKGDYAEGIATLSALEPKDMDRADVHRALVKADLATGSAREAMLETELLVKADPSATSDPKLLEDVRNVALGKGEASDTAFALMQTGFGPVGVDMLYDIAYATWAHDYPSASGRARKALTTSEVRAKGSPAVQIALDLRAASTCTKQHDLLARAADVGDYRRSRSSRPTYRRAAAASSPAATAGPACAKTTPCRPPSNEIEDHTKK